MTGLVRGTLFAVIGGLIGAALWAAVAYYAHVNLGIIAWVVGLCAGAGMKLGAGTAASSLSGFVAAVVALVSIAGGKFVTAYAIVHDRNVPDDKRLAATLDVFQNSFTVLTVLFAVIALLSAFRLGSGRGLK